MDLTVYLPDEIGKTAKAEGINFSATLRNAIGQELERRRVMRQAVSDSEVYEVDLVNKDGGHYVGKITGKLIGDEDRDFEVYLTEDERVIVYDQKRQNHEVMSLDEAREGLDPIRFCGALAALGITPEIDL